MFGLHWVAKIIVIVTKCIGRIDASMKSVRRKHTNPTTKIGPNLKITIPAEIESDWTFPSPRNAQKQRKLTGADANDISVRVLPYLTQMGNNTTDWRRHVG